ncbi:MAG TPA: HAD family hydrolase [Patescibacteria group bacterium]|nr:HAD family hydrolase [Patescibacteria group bacterium]
MIKLIIFDWDDTFTLGSTDGYLACYHEALTSVGITLSPEEEKARVLPTWGTGHVKGIEALLREYPELVPDAVKKWEDSVYGDVFVNQLQLVKGSVALLNRLAKQYMLAIATGGDIRIVRERAFPKFQIPDVFAQVTSTYELADPLKGKPHPYMLELIMKTQNIKPEETIMVGDAKNDVLMAQNAGIETVVVLTGHLSRKEAEELGVKHIIDDVTKLETVL